MSDCLPYKIVCPFSVFLPACLPCLSQTTPFCPSNYLSVHSHEKTLFGYFQFLKLLTPTPPFFPLVCMSVCLASHLSVSLSVCPLLSSFLQACRHCLSPITAYPQSRLSVCLAACLSTPTNRPLLPKILFFQ